MEKTIEDFMDCCHCGDPEYKLFMQTKKQTAPLGETLPDYVTRTTPKILLENCIITYFTVKYKRQSDSIPDPNQKPMSEWFVNPWFVNPDQTNIDIFKK